MTAKKHPRLAEAKATLLSKHSKQSTRLRVNRSGRNPLRVPYLEKVYLPVGAGGGGGGGGGAQQAETPSVAAAKATKVKYLIIVILCSLYISGSAQQARKALISNVFKRS